MAKIAIIADSTCDIPQFLREKHNIYVVPLHLLWGSQDLLDGPDLSAEDFYTRLMIDPVQPSTSAPSIGEFIAVFEQARADGADGIILVTLSKELSSTYSTAQIAIEQVNYPVHLWDTGSTSMGGGWQTLRAAEARDKGAGREELLGRMAAIKQSSVVYLSVDTLDYLHRGGRIGGAAKWIGTMLNLKPLLRSNLSEGTVEPIRAVRTRTKAIDALFDTFVEQAQAISQTALIHVAIVHAAAETEARALEKRLRKIRQVDELMVVPGSPVLGMHTGPGTLALCGYVDIQGKEAVT